MSPELIKGRNWTIVAIALIAVVLSVFIMMVIMGGDAVEITAILFLAIIFGAFVSAFYNGNAAARFTLVLFCLVMGICPIVFLPKNLLAWVVLSILLVFCLTAAAIMTLIPSAKAFFRYQASGKDQTDYWDQKLTQIGQKEKLSSP
ncbi:MAG: hypothetical protein AAF206_16915 [Bacteroidota bacterium]